jgi:HPt (histidine-containing phosphotransfer) domain-containing protein
MTQLPDTLDPVVLAELRESVGDDPEFVAELIDDFLAAAPAQLELLSEAATSGDAPGANRVAHTLKGTARMFGARGLASLCQDAETAAGAGDLDAVRARLSGIAEEWARVGTELIALRSGRA